jgi:divalent metal cation (Fe/Co/Zn/Cd) transporter
VRIGGTMLGWPLMDPAASLLVSFLIAKEGTA